MALQGSIFSQRPIQFLHKGNAKLKEAFPFQTLERGSRSHGQISRKIPICSSGRHRSLQHIPFKRPKSRLEWEGVGQPEFHIAEPPPSERDPGPWTLRTRLDLDARIPALSLKLMQSKRLLRAEKPMGMLEMSADHALSSLLAIVRALLHRVATETYNDPSLSTENHLPVDYEISSSFLWIFHHVLSSTPSLMLSTMLLATNFAAHSVVGFEGLGSMDSTHILDPSSLSKDRFSDEKLQTALTWVSEEGWASFNRRKRRRSDQVVEEEEEEEVEEEEEEDPTLYEATELRYLRAIADEPDNPLLLSNYAQFLYLIVRDSGRAEWYFKRSVVATPADAEAIGRYAVFLWQERRDLTAAEEAFLEAIDVSAGNPHLVASYASFLWHTGGQDTCCTDSLDAPIA